MQRRRNASRSSGRVPNDFRRVLWSAFGARVPNLPPIWCLTSSSPSSLIATKRSSHGTWYPTWLSIPLELLIWASLLLTATSNLSYFLRFLILSCPHLGSQNRASINLRAANNSGFSPQLLSFLLQQPLPGGPLAPFELALLEGVGTSFFGYEVSPLVSSPMPIYVLLKR